MTNTVVLNSQDHQDLKVDTRCAPEFGDSVNRVMIFSAEFSDIQKEYPILFYREPNTLKLQTHAILGFDRDENLFLDQGIWQGHYVPGALARGPFMIGFQAQNNNGEVRKEPVVHVDLHHPRVGTVDGEPLFLPEGANSPYLDKVIRTLKVLYQGSIFDKTLFSILDDMELLEPVTIEVTLSNIEQYNLSNYYTVNEEKLTGLAGEDLAKLHKLGVLKLLYFAQASLGNMHRLIELKNQKSAMVP